MPCSFPPYTIFTGVSRRCDTKNRRMTCRGVEPLFAVRKAAVLTTRRAGRCSVAVRCRPRRGLHLPRGATREEVRGVGNILARGTRPDREDSKPIVCKRRASSPFRVIPHAASLTQAPRGARIPLIDAGGFGRIAIQWQSAVKPHKRENIASSRKIDKLRKINSCRLICSLL